MSSKSTYEFPLRSTFSGSGRPGKEAGAGMSEKKLWKAFQSGDEKAFASIYEHFADPLFSYGMKLVPHRERVMDVIQDLFVGMWESRGRLGDVRSIKAYLFISLRRKVLARTAESRKIVLSGDKEEALFPGKIASAEQQFIEGENVDMEYRELEKAISLLNDKQREIIYLKFYAKMNYEDIATIMETDKKAAYNLMARTIERLKHLMGGMLVFLIVAILIVLKG